jgi:hypothetical protein
MVGRLSPTHLELLRQAIDAEGSELLGEWVSVS